MATREQLYKDAKNIGLPQALKALLIPMKRGDAQLPTHARSYARVIDFKCAGQSICQQCYALVVDMLNAGVVVRYTHTWEEVRTAICRGVEIEKSVDGVKLTQQGKVINVKTNEVSLSTHRSSYSNHEMKMPTEAPSAAAITKLG